MLDIAARAFRAAGLHEKAAEAMLELGIVSPWCPSFFVVPI